MSLRTDLIYPRLLNALKGGYAGLTVNYLVKADDYQSTAEEVRNELLKMRQAKLVQSLSGGRWCLTEIGRLEASGDAKRPDDRTPSPVVDQQTDEGESEAPPAISLCQDVPIAEPDTDLHQALSATQQFADTLCNLTPKTSADTRQAIHHLGRFLDESIAAELEKLLADADQLAAIKQQAQAVFRTQ